MATSSFAFTDLVQPGSTVSQTVPAGFDAAIAYLLGQCCNVTYDQYNQGPAWSPDWSSLVVAGVTVSLATVPRPLVNPQVLTRSEAVGPGATPGDMGEYVQRPAGFAVQLTCTPSAGGTAQTIVVIALRGTRSWQEWMSDVEAIPVQYVGGNGTSLGTVHGGFFADYTVGTGGALSLTPLGNTTTGPRAPGSLAAQIQSYVSPLDGSLPVYVTGHSLGAALTVLSALDVAYNFPTAFSSIAAYPIACPRVAVGLNGVSLLDPVFGAQETFLQNYQTLVPNTYPITHACDIMPVLPPLATAVGPLTLACAHVTDQWGGIGAVATATLDSAGGVASITLSGPMAGYLTAHLPNVLISGGGGSGAQATATVNWLGGMEVNVTAQGSGYTTPPAVQIVSTGPSLLANVVNFCAQTGDIGNNHSCANTYVPYLAKLAAGLSGS